MRADAGGFAVPRLMTTASFWVRQVGAPLMSGFLDLFRDNAPLPHLHRHPSAHDGKLATFVRKVALLDAVMFSGSLYHWPQLFHHLRTQFRRHVNWSFGMPAPSGQKLVPET